MAKKKTTKKKSTAKRDFSQSALAVVQQATGVKALKPVKLLR
jgi:hypothetical protein